MNVRDSALTVFDAVSSAHMESARKITVEISPELPDKAQAASGPGLVPTVRVGLQFEAASKAYEKLRGLRGKACCSSNSAELKADR